MALPQNELYATAPVGNYRLPDDEYQEIDANSTPSNLLIISDKELGGQALQDPTQGLLVLDWYAKLVGNEIRISKANTPADYIVAVTAPNITTFSLTFDQNMNWALAYVSNDVLHLSWFDVGISTRVLLVFNSGEYSPFLSLDDKRRPAALLNQSDMLLFYLKSSWLCYRQQRDLFLVERQLVQLTSTEPMRIRRAGMTLGLRMQVEIENATVI
jgi:hypothetical protein